MFARINALIIAFAIACAPANAGLSSIWGFLSSSSFNNYYSLKFNGTNQAAACGTSINTNFEYNKAFSVSTWIKPTGSLGGEYTLFGNAGPASDRGAWFEVFGNKLRLVLYPSGGSPSYLDVRGTATIPLNIWSHIVWSYDGSGSPSGVSFYVNGATDASSSHAGNVTTSIMGPSDFSIAQTDGDPFVPAYLDETFVRSAATTPTEASNMYNNGVPINVGSLISNPIAWWRYEKTISPADTASLIYDRIGSNNCTPSNIISGDFKTDVPNNTPYNDVAVTANGTSYINYGSPSSLQPTLSTPFSVDYWLYIDALNPLDQSFIGNNPSGGYGGWNMVVNGTNGRMQVEFDAVSPSDYFGVEGSSGDFTVGTWQNWGFSYDGSNSPSGIKVYRNGVLLTTTTYGSPTLAGALNGGFPLTVFNQGGSGGSQWASARMYGITYWSKELNAGTFSSLYGGGHAIDPSTLSDYASFCVSNWKYNYVWSGGGVFSFQILDVKGTNTGTALNLGYDPVRP